MAVSQMQKLSLILPKDDLDSLLLALQSEAKIQIYDLSEQEEWQAAFEANTLSQSSSLGRAAKTSRTS